MNLSYIQYAGNRSVGCVLFWLSQYYNYWMVDHVCITDGDSVTLNNKIIATYTWDENNVPTFVFCGENANDYNKNQERLKAYIIEELNKYLKMSKMRGNK